MFSSLYVACYLFIRFRTGRFDENTEPRQLASATNLILGTFMLWWGWLGFNCGSTFGVSGGKEFVFMGFYFFPVGVLIMFVVPGYLCDLSRVVAQTHSFLPAPRPTLY